MADIIPFEDDEALSDLGRLIAPLPEPIILKGKKIKVSTAKRVGKINGLTVCIFADEHPPPHVCIKYQGESANYRISDGHRIAGGLARYDRQVIPWLVSNKAKLITEWDNSRPTDCPVGKYREPGTA